MGQAIVVILLRSLLSVASSSRQLAVTAAEMKTAGRLPSSMAVLKEGPLYPARIAGWLSSCTLDILSTRFIGVFPEMLTFCVFADSDPGPPLFHGLYMVYAPASFGEHRWLYSDSNPNSGWHCARIISYLFPSSSLHFHCPFLFDHRAVYYIQYSRQLRWFISYRTNTEC